MKEKWTFIWRFCTIFGLFSGLILHNFSTQAQQSHLLGPVSLLSYTKVVNDTAVRGRVVTKNKLPVDGVKVLVANSQIPPATTDIDGYFTLDLPKGFAFGSTNNIIVFGAKLKGVGYVVSRSNNFVLITVNREDSERLNNVLIFDSSKKPISKLNILINGFSYISNAAGKIILKGTITKSAKFQIRDYRIISKVFVQKAASVHLYVSKIEKEVAVKPPPPKPDTTTTKDTTQQVDSTEQKKDTTIQTLTSRQATIISRKTYIDADFSVLEKAKIIFKLKSEKIEKQINEIQKRLSSDANLDSADRARLQAQLEKLQRDLAKNRADYDRYQVDVRRRIAKMKKLLSDTKEELARTQLERKLEKQQAFTRSIIFISLALIAAVVAIFLYFISRRRKKQKEQLAEKVLEINQQKEEITAQRDMIEEQAIELEKRNEKITDSIRYAQTIQDSILPTKNMIHEVFRDSFIFYRPKDIVSGDFYWFTQKGDDLIISAIDCTGHGVPGGFMTMMGNSLLNQIINVDNILDPAEILNLLDAKVKETLQTHLREEDDERGGDGMDMVLLKLNLKERKGTFAGAKNPLYYIHEGQEDLLYIRGTSMSIGSLFSKKGRTYKSHEFDIQGDETFYLVTDGYQDQLGGASKNPDGKRKKFMRQRFMDILKSGSKLPMNEQKAILDREFEEWKEIGDQTDDVTVIGIKIDLHKMQNGQAVGQDFTSDSSENVNI